MKKEVEYLKWKDGPPAEIMAIKMPMDEFESISGSIFKTFEEDQGKEWAMGFELETIGNLMILVDENIPGKILFFVEERYVVFDTIELLLREFNIPKDLLTWTAINF